LTLNRACIANDYLMEEFTPSGDNSKQIKQPPKYAKRLQTVEPVAAFFTACVHNPMKI